MANAKTKSVETDGKTPMCGIIMPISAMNVDGHDYTEEHWKNVLDIISDAAKEADFSARIVSDNDSSHVIQTTIVKNLYNNELVICDISGNNPNVIFELGLRCAFDKMVIIIKDGPTKFNFDLAPCHHITYDRALDYKMAIALKKELIQTIRATSKEEGGSPFLKQFGEMKPKNLGEREMELFDILNEKIDMLMKVNERSRMPPSTDRYRDSLFKIRLLDLVKARGYSFSQGFSLMKETIKRGSSDALHAATYETFDKMFYKWWSDPILIVNWILPVDDVFRDAVRCVFVEEFVSVWKGRGEANRRQTGSI